MDPPPDDCWEPDVRAAMTRWTRPFNFLGWPAIAVGGLQIAGRDRSVVLGAALALEARGVRIPRASLLSRRPAAGSTSR